MIVAETEELCLQHTKFALDILSKAGFFIHYDKSVLQPFHCLRFLKFILDSKQIQIYSPETKVDKLKNCTHDLLHAKSVTVERLAQVIDFLASCLPAFWFGRLNYRGLEFLKIDANCHESYRSKVKLLAAAKTDLHWWQSNADSSGSPIKWQDFADELCTDGSLQGCGAFFENQSIGSRWTSEELRQYMDIVATVWSS